MKYLYRRAAEIAVVSIMLAACATFGVPKAENFDEKVVAAYASVEAGADLVATLHAAGKISKEEGYSVLDKLLELNAAIRAAVAVRDAGDFSNAETRLSTTIAALEIVLSQLRAKQ